MALSGVVGLLATGLVAASQSGGIYDGDEGLHLVALLLVNHGQRPFVDFFYWHQPLYLYVASAWSLIVGETWRAVHLLSGLLTGLSIWLVAQVTRIAIPSGAEREPWPVLAACLFALNALIVQWGTTAHNYALCTTFALVAVHLALGANGRTARLFASGACAGAATATSLLIAPLGPALIIWLTAVDRHRSVAATWGTFLAGFAIPFTPLLLLYWQDPEATVFGIVTHHLYYRVTVPGDIASEVIVGVVQSPQALLLVGLGTCAVVGWWRRWIGGRPAAVLCASVTVVLAVFVSVVHPPVHAVYFAIVAPFAAVMAAFGAHCVTTRCSALVNREWLVVAGVVGVFASGLAWTAYRERLWESEWERIERFADAVETVTPPHGSFYTSYPFVYFAARRTPPPGFENGWASQMRVESEVFDVLELEPAPAIAEQVRSGQFDTILIRRDDGRFDPVELDRSYRWSRPLDEYFVLRWRDASRPVQTSR